MAGPTREIFKDRLYDRLPESAPYTHENLAILVCVLYEFLSEMTRVCPAPRGQMDSMIEKQIKETVYEILLAWLEGLPIPYPDNSEQKATITAWAIYGASVLWSQKPALKPSTHSSSKFSP